MPKLVSQTFCTPEALESLQKIAEPKNVRYIYVKILAMLEMRIEISDAKRIRLLTVVVSDLGKAAFK